MREVPRLGEKITSPRWG